MIIVEVIIPFCGLGKQHFLFGSFVIAFPCVNFEPWQTPKLTSIPSQNLFVFGIL